MERYKRYNIEDEKELRRDGYFEHHSSDEDGVDEYNKNVHYPQSIYPQPVDIKELIEYRKKLKSSYVKY